ncbi:MAG: short chain dehydrogenase [Hyphomicrobiales bacterium]|nr:MAG: short chain dehydrogenase [Hyphomicrobiales bacterium]
MTRSDTSHPVALVTGAAQRIGRAIAKDLAANGYAVAIHYRSSRAPAEELADEIRAAGYTAATVQADLADLSSVAGVMADANAALGPVTLLINNASLFENDEIGGLDIDLWQAHMAVNLTAPCLLAEALAAQLPDGAEGNVINLIDQRVWKLTPQFFSYTLSKSALWSATKTMAQALAPRVRVNGIGPGPTLANERQSADDFKKQTDAVLLQRGPDLADFGRTVRYIVETRSMTGQMIALDGGQHLAWETPDVAGIVE